LYAAKLFTTSIPPNTVFKRVKSLVITARSLATVVLIGAGFAPYLEAKSAQIKSFYVDANYRKVKTKRKAIFRIEQFEQNDSVHFTAFALHPKGVTERGTFPRQKGFDTRNCSVEQIWPNGMIRARGNRINSYPEGLWYYYDYKGKLYSTVYFLKGVPNGQSIRYYADGTTRRIMYENGLKEGVSVLLDNNNDTLEIAFYSADQRHGLTTILDENHQIMERAVYYYGQKLKDTLFFAGLKPCLIENFDTSGRYNGRCMLYNNYGKIVRFDDFSHGDETQNACLHPIKTDDWNNGECHPRKIEPRFPGGDRKYETFIRMNQDYPETAELWRAQGIVEITVKISADGSVKRVMEDNLIPAGFGLDEEAMRLLQIAPKFEPMMINGEPRPSEKQFVFAFIL
jgi:antitoxin component YwqK of YwqJK toxin-antitoxin module